MCDEFWQPAPNGALGPIFFYLGNEADVTLCVAMTCCGRSSGSYSTAEQAQPRQSLTVIIVCIASCFLQVYSSYYMRLFVLQTGDAGTSTTLA